MMQSFIRATLAVAIIFSMLWFTERTAYGYVDPGSGLFVCQSAGALVAGTLYCIRRWLKRAARPLLHRVTQRQDA